MNQSAGRERKQLAAQRTTRQTIKIQLGENPEAGRSNQYPQYYRRRRQFGVIKGLSECGSLILTVTHVL